MNQSYKRAKNSKSLRFHHKNPKMTMKTAKHLLKLFPNQPREYIVICIGTDRSTGDSLGPLTGTLLNQKDPKNLIVYGTIHEPVHATNLNDYLKHIYQKYKDPYIIAVDACLGRHLSIGYITADKGPVKPGAALNKKLPPVGDVHLTGIVNISGFMEYTILQSTRLSVVFDMAQKIANVLEKIDQNLTEEKKLSSFFFPRGRQHSLSLKRRKIL